jgi:hypothetical protein
MMPFSRISAFQQAGAEFPDPFAGLLQPDGGIIAADAVERGTDTMRDDFSLAVDARSSGKKRTRFVVPPGATQR